MSKSTKSRFALLALITTTSAMALASCGNGDTDMKTETETDTALEQSVIYSFDHKLPDDFFKQYNLSVEGLDDFKDKGILFWGGAMRDPRTKTTDVGVQFHAQSAGRDIFVEKMRLNTATLQTEEVINETVKIDNSARDGKVYFKRLYPFKGVEDASIPPSEDSFTLEIDYRIDDGPSRQMTIRFDKTAMLAPIL